MSITLTSSSGRRRAGVWTLLRLAYLLPAPVLAAGLAPPQPLFADNSILAFEFELNLAKICRNPEKDDCADLPGVIRYVDAEDTEVQLDVIVRTRGRWSRRTSACSVPSLFVYFDESQTGGTLFENQRMLPFTTHCMHGDRRYQEYAIKEYVAHQIYNLITPASLKTRLVYVTYIHPDSKKPRYTRYGFFVEHFENAGKRLNGRVIEIESLDPRDTDPNELATLSVFQYMIGNLDWSVTKQHNIVLFERNELPIVAVPFDFDYTGLVSAEYALPPKHINVRNVRVRRFRGFCRDEIDWNSIFSHFDRVRGDVESLIDTTNELSRGARRNIRLYLDTFWDLIASRERRQKKIVKACRTLPSN